MQRQSFTKKENLCSQRLSNLSIFMVVIEGGQKNQETLSERLEYYQTNQPNRHEKSEIT